MFAREWLRNCGVMSPERLVTPYHGRSWGGANVYAMGRQYDNQQFAGKTIQIYERLQVVAALCLRSRCSSKLQPARQSSNRRHTAAVHYAYFRNFLGLSSRAHQPHKYALRQQIFDRLRP